jgi:hypothetical protein
MRATSTLRLCFEPHVVNPNPVNVTGLAVSIASHSEHRRFDAATSNGPCASARQSRNADVVRGALVNGSSTSDVLRPSQNRARLT